MSGKTIALVNLNRRSGKTTSALNLGVELAARGSSVLVVDASTDGQLSQLPGLSDTGVVLERREERMVMRGTALDGLAVLCRAGHVLNHPAGVSDNIETLRRLQEQFDWVIYDTHSGDCSALRHVLSIAESVLIPLQPDLRSVELLPPTLSLLLDLHRKGAPAAVEAIFFAHTTRAGSGTDSRQAMDCYIYPGCLPAARTEGRRSIQGSQGRGTPPDTGPLGHLPREHPLRRARRRTRKPLQSSAGCPDPHRWQPPRHGRHPRRTRRGTNRRNRRPSHAFPAQLPLPTAPPPRSAPGKDPGLPWYSRLDQTTREPLTIASLHHPLRRRPRHRKPPGDSPC